MPSTATTVATTSAQTFAVNVKREPVSFITNDSQESNRAN
jgi:hypothetical protein